MTFTKESLLQIYLEGAFTEEAQEEFDRLMRTDPTFSEQVTKAVMERLGPAPESALDQIATRLDSKMPEIWEKNKPTSLFPWAKGAAALLVALGLVFGSYQGWEYFKNHAASQKETQGASGEKSPSAKPAFTLKLGGASKLKAKALPSNPDSLGGVSNLNSKPNLGVDKKEASKTSLAQTSASPTLSSEGSTGTQEGNLLRVSIETEGTQPVAVSVLDPKGLRVRVLYQGVWGPGEHLVDWDGKDQAGKPVEPGDYTVVLQSSGKTQSGTVTVPANR